uniref:Protein-arginine kinase n=1 Tax=uncultured Bacillota bacterium TaxID=344338 RepID=A0A650ENF2_9FIRM|nr:protein-arginine kinase [uncultured Firmicutes bacterium]
MWYTECGPMGDVVLSSRVRLARNIKEIPFSSRMTEEQRAQVVQSCKAAVVDGNSALKDSMKFFDLDNMETSDKQALAECHILSPQMADGKQKHRGLLLSDDQKTSILINEEDHVRIQCMAAGFDLENCLKQAERVDDILEEELTFGFDERFGYLTCCPTNVGTGLRASVMVHLPALVMNNGMERIISSLSRLGMTVRGIYGEGSKALGNIFQISNQVTLGVTEEETVQKLTRLVQEVVDTERELRKKLFDANKIALQDRIMRSYGVLTNAVSLSSEETMRMLSDVRLGVNLEIISTLTAEQVNDMMYRILPANIVKHYNLQSAADRDLKRAEIIKEIVKA